MNGALAWGLTICKTNGACHRSGMMGGHALKLQAVYFAPVSRPLI